jgi:hypothetical protein
MIPGTLCLPMGDTINDGCGRTIGARSIRWARMQDAAKGHSSLPLPANSKLGSMFNPKSPL